MRALKKIKWLKKYIIAFFIMITFFFLLKIICYSLPNNKIKNHIGESLITINNEGSYYMPFGSDKSLNFKLDGFTDSLILNMSLNNDMKKNESVFIKAVQDSFYHDDKVKFIDSLGLAYERNPINNIEYSRYWHGNQVITRTLLLFFNYSEIRFIFMIVMIILLTIVSVLTKQNIGLLNTIALMISLCCMHIFFIPMSIQFSGVTFVCLLGLIFTNLLCKYEKIDKFPILLFIFGGITSFIDLLTFPLITFGMPVLLMLIYKVNKITKIKDNFIMILKCATSWIFGYCLSYFSKWILTSIVMKQNMINEAITNFLSRTGITYAKDISRMDTFNLNFNTFFTPIILKSLVIILIIWIILLIRYKKDISKLKNCILLFIMGISPYVWYSLMNQHSYIHSFFTNRIQVITMFALLSIIIYSIDINKVKKDIDWLKKKVSRI